MRARCNHVLPSRNSFIKSYLQCCRGKTINKNVLKQTKILGLFLFSYGGCLHVCGHTRVHEHLEVREWRCVSSRMTLEHWTCWFSWLVWLANLFWDSPVSSSLAFTRIGIMGRLSHPIGIYVASENLDSAFYIHQRAVSHWAFFRALRSCALCWIWWIELIMKWFIFQNH